MYSALSSGVYQRFVLYKYFTSIIIIINGGAGSCSAMRQSDYRAGPNELSEMRSFKFGMTGNLH